MQTGAKNPKWRGGRTLDGDNAILILVPDHPRSNRHGYVRHHRLVMEEHLGRYLTGDEVVHHLTYLPTAQVAYVVDVTGKGVKGWPATFHDFMVTAHHEEQVPFYRCLYSSYA